MLLLSQCKEAFLTIDNQKNTIRVLQEEMKELASTITSIEKDISSLNSQLENRFHSEINLMHMSNLLDEKLEVREMSRDMKKPNVGTSMKDEINKIPPKKVVFP